MGQEHINLASSTASALHALRQPRHRIVLTCFLATLIAYVERTGFSISYTLLAKAAGVDEAVKGTIMSAFYWGYGISQVCPQRNQHHALHCTLHHHPQVPGGMAAQQFGGRPTLLLCFVTWSIASLATPTEARRIGVLAAARVVVGVSQGFLIPAVHTVLSQVCLLECVSFKVMTTHFRTAASFIVSHPRTSHIHECFTSPNVSH